MVDDTHDIRLLAIQLKNERAVDSAKHRDAPCGELGPVVAALGVSRRPGARSSLRPYLFFASMLP